MLITIRDKLFFMIILFIIFCNIPHLLQLNFLGGFLGKDLSFYPIMAGVFYSIYLSRRNNNLKIHREDKIFFTYIFIYTIVLVISFLHGIMIYPYYNAILAGPADQIDKLPVVQHFLSGIGMQIETKTLLKFWMLARSIKGFIIDIFWYFTVPYLIFLWYRECAHKGFSILIKAVLAACILVCLYNMIDFFYLGGSATAEDILVLLNPIIHEIKSNGTWWPPLLWQGQLRSLFAEPSYYGIFSSFAIPFLWYKISFLQSKNSKVAIVAVTFIITYGLFLTKARTANILFFGELSLLVLFSLWVQNRKFFMKTACIVALSFFAFIVSTFSLNYLPGSPAGKTMGYDHKNSAELYSYLEDNIGSLSSKDKRSNRARFSILEASINIGKDFPMLGVGKSLRNAYVPDYLPKEGKESGEIQYWIMNQKEKGILKSGFPALGEYCTRFAETGILGLIVYLIPIAFLLIQLLKRIYLEENTKSCEQYIFFFISLAGVLASGLGDNLSITCAYWILMGIGYAMCFGKNNISTIKSK